MVTPFINLLNQGTLKQGCLHILSITKSFWLFLLPFPSFPVLPLSLFSPFPLLPLLSKTPSNRPPPILAVASSFVFPLLILQSWSCMHLFTTNFTTSRCLRIKSTICCGQEDSLSGALGLPSFSISTTHTPSVSGLLYPSYFSSLIPALLPQWK